MKRFIVLIILVFCLVGLTSAQNANRSGFIIEAGIGGIIGNTPRTSYLVTNNNMQIKCVSGTAIDFGLGYRLRFKSHWAYEIKAEAQTALSNIVNTLVGRFLPIGFRYTSVEIWKNYSLYAHINLGAAISTNNGYLQIDNIIYPNTSDQPIKGDVGYGPAYALGVGANVTTHLYFEACLNGQALFNCYGKNNKKGLLNEGFIGGVLGYRF